MSEIEPEALPQCIVDEAWIEFVYPRVAVGELDRPHEQSGFMRAVRVFQQWARQHDEFWSGLVELNERRGRELAAAELESLATEMERSSKHLPVTAEDVRARADQFRNDASSVSPQGVQQ